MGSIYKFESGFHKHYYRLVYKSIIKCTYIFLPGLGVRFKPRFKPVQPDFKILFFKWSSLAVDY